MSDAWLRVSTNRNYKVALLAFLFFELLFLRRSEQLIHPQVWDEDAIFLRDLITEGLRSFLNPVQGYLCTLPRVIAAVSLPISFVHYPLVTTTLAWAFIVFSLIAVALSPTLLRGGAFLAIALLLVPSDPEVIGIPVYTFWFAAILMFIAALWTPGAPGFWRRAMFVTLSGLSSPAVLLALPLFFARSLVLRRPPEYILTGIAFFCSALQLFVLHLDPVGGTGGTKLSHALGVVPTFFGSYLIGNLTHENILALTITGIGTLAFVITAVSMDRSNLALYLLCYLYFGSIILVGSRIDIVYLNPVATGPRYFFLPYIFEGWFLIQIAAAGRTKPMRYAAALMLVTALANSLPVLNRGHIDLHWSDRVAACARTSGSQTYRVPVEFDGKGLFTWSIDLSGDQCRKLISDSLWR